MPKADIEIRGARQLRRKLSMLDGAIDDLKAIHKEAADVVMSEALARVPVETGTLRDTIRSSGTKTGGRVRAGFKRVPYAGPIHFGWPRRNIEPQPFLYDALDSRRRQVLDVYQDRLGDLLRRYDL